jgi:hypothetical protein
MDNTQRDTKPPAQAANKLRPAYRNSMCPAGVAVEHPAAAILMNRAQFGCPTKTGKPWTRADINEAIKQGPHQPALSPEAIQHLAEEIKEKIRTNQARVIEWDTIKDNPPPGLKISPIAAIPHKSKAFWSILDLSFQLRLRNGGFLDAVNDITEKMALGGAIDQTEECLTCIIHAFAKANDNNRIFMSNWDVKDRFWRMNWRAGEEWNFTYVLPQPPGEPVQLVVLTLLQIGWVESPPYFCVATKTAQDIATEYIETELGTRSRHKFEVYAMGAPEAMALPEESTYKDSLKNMLEVYVDDFVNLIIPASQKHLWHVANAIMEGIHGVFPPDQDDSNDPISEKKMRKTEGQYATLKTILRFNFDGVAKTLWLEEAKGEKLLTMLHRWIKAAIWGSGGIPFKQFKTTVAKLRHAFTAISAGVGLLSPCNCILATKPKVVWLNQNKQVFAALKGCHTLLQESTKDPTRCRELVAGWPDFGSIVDASSYGVGGVVLGELSECISTVFWWEWPEYIRKEIKSFRNPTGSITNSDLEMAGMILLWLVIESVCGVLAEK